MKKLRYIYKSSPTGVGHHSKRGVSKDMLIASSDHSRSIGIIKLIENIYSLLNQEVFLVRVIKFKQV